MRLLADIRHGLREDDGWAMVTVMAISVILFLMITAMLALTAYRISQSTRYAARTTAMQEADAGINYYLYRLSLDNGFDETPSQSNPQGSWAASSTYDTTSHLLTIRSVGTSAADGSKRTVVALCSPPPPPMYAVGSGGNIDVGANTTINGPMRSNGYVHITTGGSAGIITGLAQSGVAPKGDFTPLKNGVPDPSRFKGGAQYYPPLGFDTMTSDVAAMKANAQLLLPSSRSDGKTPSALGYRIILSGNQVVIRRVLSVSTTVNSTTTVTNLGKLTLDTQASTQSTVPIPANGVIYVDKDNVWVSGTYTARVTICASRSSASDSTYGNIWVVNSVRCGDTSNPRIVCGLMAQNSVWLADWYSLKLSDGTVYTDPTLMVQAALLAQYGGVGDNVPSAIANKGGTKYSGTFYYPQHDLDLEGSVLGKTGVGFDTSYFLNRTYGFDERLKTNPPPYWPRGNDPWILVSSWLEN